MNDTYLPSPYSKLERIDSKNVREWDVVGNQAWTRDLVLREEALALLSEAKHIGLKPYQRYIKSEQNAQGETLHYFRVGIEDIQRFIEFCPDCIINPPSSLEERGWNR